MGVSVHIKGYREPTKEYLAKLRAYRACDEAGLRIPDELDAYFGGEYPGEEGMTVDVREAIDGRVEYEGGAVINLSELPEGVTKIRVYMS